MHLPILIYTICVHDFLWVIPVLRDDDILKDNSIAHFLISQYLNKDNLVNMCLVEICSNLVFRSS